jgi:hypothetical protein
VSKKILRRESQTVVSEGGVVKSHTRKTVIQFPKEPPFIKLYLDDVNRLYELPNNSTALLYELIKRLDYDGFITLNSTTKKMIGQRAGVSTGHIDNYLSKLVKKDIFRREGRGTYAPNPDIFGRGDWREIYKKRSAWLKVSYGENGRKLNSSFGGDS